MATVEERLSRLEGVYNHLATRADLAAIDARFAQMESRIIKAMVASLIPGTGVAVAVAVAAVNFLGG